MHFVRKAEKAHRLARKLGDVLIILVAPAVLPQDSHIMQSWAGPGPPKEKAPIRPMRKVPCGGPGGRHRTFEWLCEIQSPYCITGGRSSEA